MTISNVSVAPSTCSHIVITATIGGVVRTIHATRDEIAASDPEEYRAAFLARLRSFQLEGNYTFAQVRNNLVGKVFEI